MTFKVQHVEPNYLHQVWPLVEPWLAKAFEHSALSKYYNIEHLKDYIIRGEQVLLVGTDEAGEIKGAGTIQWMNYPNARVAYITSLGGKLITSKENHQELINWVRAMGATRIEGSCRESTARLWRQKLGYTPRQITMELDV